MPEPKIWKVTIVQGATGASFIPAALTINLNDSVFWVNNTPNSQQPAPDDGTAGQWVPQPIPPGGQSTQVVFDSATPASNPYHSNAAKGVITVEAEN
jgi:hypothetical protein